MGSMCVLGGGGRGFGVCVGGGGVGVCVGGVDVCVGGGGARCVCWRGGVGVCVGGGGSVCVWGAGGGGSCPDQHPERVNKQSGSTDMTEDEE